MGKTIWVSESEKKRYQDWKASGGRFIDTSKEDYPQTEAVRLAKRQADSLAESHAKINGALVDMGLAPIYDTASPVVQTERERQDAMIYEIVWRR